MSDENDVTLFHSLWAHCNRDSQLTVHAAPASTPWILTSPLAGRQGL